MPAPRIPRLPAGHNSRWPSTMFVGDAPAPAKLHPLAAALAWSLGLAAFAAVCAVVVGAVIGIGWIVSVVLPAALDALAVAALGALGVTL